MMTKVTAALLLLSTLLLSSFTAALNLFSNNNAKAPFRTPLRDEDIPTLTDWSLKDNKIVGVVSNHPVVPDGELLTTAAVAGKDIVQMLKQQQQQHETKMQTGTSSKKKKKDEPPVPLTLTTVKGTQYKLVMTANGGTASFKNKNKKNIFNSNMQRNTPSKKHKQMGYYYSTSLPYDQQLAFLEELTASIKALQAQESGGKNNVCKKRSVSLCVMIDMSCLYHYYMCLISSPSSITTEQQ